MGRRRGSGAAGGPQARLYHAGLYLLLVCQDAGGEGRAVVAAPAHEHDAARVKGPRTKSGRSLGNRLLLIQ